MGWISGGVEPQVESVVREDLEGVSVLVLGVADGRDFEATGIELPPLGQCHMAA